MSDNGELMARGLIQGLHADRERLEKLVGELAREVNDLQRELRCAQESLREAEALLAAGGYTPDRVKN